MPIKLPNQGIVSKKHQTKDLSNSNSFYNGVRSNVGKTNKIILTICYVSFVILSYFIFLQISADVETN